LATISSLQTAAFAPNRERVFDAVLAQEVPWRRLAGSAVCAMSFLGILLGAAMSAGHHQLQELHVHVDPVVTFLDEPKPVQDEAKPDDSIASGGAAGAQTDQISSGLSLGKVHAAAALLKPERIAAMTDRAKETVADEAPRDTAATPTPVAQGGGRANEGPAAVASAVSTAAGSPEAIGNGVGGGGGTGTGNGGGVGSGVGTGMQTANNGARFGVLPFGEGMSRPVLQSKIDPTYTREAADAKVGGLALIKCVLTTQGTVRECRIVKGLPLMNDAILGAVSRWRYSPVMYQGAAVSVDYLITLHLSPP
jgi:protein TonB